MLECFSRLDYEICNRGKDDVFFLSTDLKTQAGVLIKDTVSISNVFLDQIVWIWQTSSVKVWF